MSVNDLLAFVGASSLKPLASVLLLPPVPFVLLALLGAMLLWRGRGRGGWSLALVAVAGLWLSQCLGMGRWLESALLSSPPALSQQDLTTLKRSTGRRVVLVLGGGREGFLPEYAQSHLNRSSAQRLHYGLYLARRIDAPVMFSGGTGFAQQGDASEAEIAARIAERDYGMRLRWIETESRDTRENARNSLVLLERAGGIDQIVLVSHAWHLPRALRAFREAAHQWPKPPQLIAAPVSEGGGDMWPWLRWMPSPAGAQLVNEVLHERIGLALGA